MTRKLAVLLAGLAAAILAVTMAGAASAADAPDPRAATPLRITDVTPDGGSIGVPVGGDITLGFDKHPMIESLYDNVKIRKSGARKWRPVDWEAYSYGPQVAAFRSREVLQPDTVYQVLVDGGRDGVRGIDGSKLGGVTDPSAKFKDGNIRWSFRTAE